MTQTSPNWLKLPVSSLDKNAENQALERQSQLTKPLGSLGKLEQIAIRFAAMQANPTPHIDNIHMTVFAADHGIAESGVSAFPQSVTAEMVRNFASGGAAISVLAQQLNAKLSVINVGTVTEIESLKAVTDHRIAAGTANFTQQAAMTTEQCTQALNIGYETAKQAHQQGCDLFIAGEMGIANTSAATAIASVLIDMSVEQLVGPGTGLDKQGITHKTSLLKKAIEKHQQQLTDPLEVLRYLGGFEIAAMTGAYLYCAQHGLPVVIDGYIATSAALIADKLLPNASDWFIFSHQSAEPGHQLMMSAFGQTPLLDLGMRLGEGSGAAVLVPLLQLSLALHNRMATFSDANVSEQLA